jgi:hypothetical protein
MVFREFLRSIFRTASGWIGAALILFQILWKIFWAVVSAMGDADYFMNHIPTFLYVLNTWWGTLAIVVVGLVFIYRAAASQQHPSHAGSTVPGSFGTPQGNGARTRTPQPAQQIQASDVDLKAPCIKLSEELFQFVSRRDKDDPHNTTWIADANDAELNEYSHKSTQYINETMDRYDQQYAGRVMSLFEALEHRGLWNPERLDPEERKHVQDPGTPYDIRKIARQLSRVGHKLDGSLGRSDYEMQRAENEGSGTEAEVVSEVLADEKGWEHTEDLKRRCRELADELRQFLEDNENLDKEQTMRLYNRRLGDKASALLQELEEHGLYPPRNLKSYQLAANAKPLSPFAIRNLAKTLGTIGHKR